MHRYQLKHIAAAFAVVLTLTGSSGALDSNEVRPVEPIPASPVASGWIVRSGDNICGLSDPKKLSNPGRVRYTELRDATPEMKKMKDKNIDPSSPEGIQLKQAAVDRIRNASDAVRGERGHCSVWKKIRHKDGRSIPDLTDLVKKRF